MTHGGLLERKLKCNEISFSLKTQTEIQTIFFVSLFCLKKLSSFIFFFLSCLVLECVLLWFQVIAVIKSRNTEILLKNCAFVRFLVNSKCR